MCWNQVGSSLSGARLSRSIDPAGSSRRGVTLIELVIVCLMVGILAAMAIPQYIRTVETTKADAGVLMLRKIGTANMKFAVDHGGKYVNGMLPLTTCPAQPCPDPVDGALGESCLLVWCQYLPSETFFLPYMYFPCDPGSAASCGALDQVARNQRTTGASPGTNDPDYSGWGYSMDKTGKVRSVGGAPEPLP